MSASKRGKRNRRKGGAFEREVVNMLKGAGLHASREGWKQRRKGATEPDVVAGPFAIECKVGVRPGLLKALQQAEENKGEGIPVVIARFQRSQLRSWPETVVMMRETDWLAMAAVFAQVMGDASEIAVSREYAAQFEKAWGSLSDLDWSSERSEGGDT